MSKQSFNLDKSLRLKPIDLTTLSTPKNGELAVDINDSNKLKKYNESNTTWETIGSGGSSTPVDTAIAALDIDWSAGDTFYKSISADSTFTFSNLVAGKKIVVFITNTSASIVNLTLPTVKAQVTLELTVYPSTTSAYSFVRSNGITYASVITDMV